MCNLHWCLHLNCTALSQSELSNYCEYLLLTELKGRTASYGPSFFLLDVWPKREARGP